MSKNKNQMNKVRNQIKKDTPVIPVGTIRIKTSNLVPYVKTSKSWKKLDFKQNEGKSGCGIDVANILHVINLFSAHDNLSLLIDKNDSRFFKGEISPDGKVKGARINVLPDGRKITGAYSLFAKNLTVHDQKSNDHWDVIYENPSGYCYLYDVSKNINFVKNKYKKVKEFEKIYPALMKASSYSLRNKNDNLSIPMYTLLKTYMRIGNEIYYKAHGHKGLTTLKKKDIKIEGNNVTFKYIAKSGVPLTISDKFPVFYVKRLKELILKGKSSFVFTADNGHPLKDIEFKHAFKRYCGKEFYPHIVRSYFATKQTEDFIKSHKSTTKSEVNSFFLSIAEKLGHKKFNKKNQEWQDNYSVTIHHYIKPELVLKVKGMIVSK